MQEPVKANIAKARELIRVINQPLGTSDMREVADRMPMKRKVEPR
jgi:hypothetical protein